MFLRSFTELYLPITGHTLWHFGNKEVDVRQRILSRNGEVRPMPLISDDVRGTLTMYYAQSRASPFNRTSETSFVSQLNATKTDYPPANIRKFWVCGTNEDTQGNLSVSLRWNDVGAHLDQDTGKALNVE